jgi:uncharacterized protein YndB with AHSA1/START domain
MLTAQEMETSTLRIEQEIRVAASLEHTFEALLEQLGPGSEMQDGTSMKMKIEPWPGGRWFRDLGDNNGHYWGTVQSIKRPTLLEFTGPLMMSQPVTNNVIYRLSQDAGETVIKFCHTGFGPILDSHRKGLTSGWAAIHDKLRQRAERP